MLEELELGLDQRADDGQGELLEALLTRRVQEADARARALDLVGRPAADGEEVRGQTALARREKGAGRVPRPGAEARPALGQLELDRTRGDLEFGDEQEGRGLQHAVVRGEIGELVLVSADHTGLGAVIEAHAPLQLHLTRGARGQAPVASPEAAQLEHFARGAGGPRRRDQPRRLEGDEGVALGHAPVDHLDGGIEIGEGRAHERPLVGGVKDDELVGEARPLPGADHQDKRYKCVDHRRRKRAKAWAQSRGSRVGSTSEVSSSSSSSPSHSRKRSTS